MKIEMALANVNVGSIVGVEATASAKARLAKLTDGAHQFEAMMLEQMLKPLKFGGSPDTAGEEDGGAGGTMQSYGTEALAKAISNGGGFGLARQIIRQVTAEDAVKAGLAGAGQMTAGAGSKVK